MLLETLSEWELTGEVEAPALQRLVVLENEEALIGAVLRSGASIFERVKEIVKPEMFGNFSYGYIWSAIERLYEDGLGIDTITVGDELERSGKIADVSKGLRAGRAVLNDLRAIGDPRNVEAYAENVQDYFVKKQLLEFAPKIALWAANGRRAAAIVKDVDTYFNRIVLYSSKSIDHINDMAESAGAAYDEVAAESRGETSAVATGLIDLDIILNRGLRKKDLIIIAARPGQGKTGFLGTCALNMATHGKRVLIFSIEMANTSITKRLLSQLSEIPVDDIIAGNLADDEWPRFTHAVEVLSQLPITIVDVSAITIGQIRQMARRLMLKKGYDIIMVDYIQLANPDKKNERRQIDVGEVSRGLKSLAKELDVPVFAAAQLSRAADKRSESRPLLSDLREAGDLEQDSDIVMFIYRPNQYDKDIAKQNSIEMIVAKHRNGKTGSVDLIWRGAFTKFENAVQKHFRPNE
jgi:replicative DNA helicase